MGKFNTSIFESNKFKFLVASILISLFFVSLALAVSVTNVSLDGNSINTSQVKFINTSQDYIFNFTVDAGGQDVSQVLVNTTVINISEIFVTGSNNTNWSSSFSNTTNLLNWTNTTTPLNGTAWFSFNFNVSNSSARPFNITIYADNGTINLIGVIQFVADNDTPIAKINSVNGLSSGDYTNNATLTINFTARDANTHNENVSFWNLSLFNSSYDLLKNWTGNNNYNISDVVYYNVSANGTYFINLKVVDFAGKVNSSTFNITVDTTPPSINITSPTTLIPTYKQPGMNITVNYFYTELNPKNLTVYLLDQNNIVSKNTLTNLSGGSINIPIPTNVTPGIYHIMAEIYDLAGNNASAIQFNSTIITNQAFNFYGYTKYVNDTLLPNTSVTINVYQIIPNQGPILVDSFSSLSNENGTFNITNITAHDNLFYKPIVRHFNGAILDYIGPSLPEFPYKELQSLGSVDFYLKEGATLNITAVNATGQPQLFNYIVKDTKLGYPIAENFGSEVNQTIVYVPADRNYSIMIYPQMAFPMSYDLNNLSSYSSPKKVDIKFNVSQEWKWVSGYVKYKGNANFDNLTIITYLLEPGNMVFKDYPLPQNMGAWLNSPINDTYNATTGFFNITLPATSTGINLLLFAIAERNGVYYGNFKNLTLKMNQTNITNFNFTLYELVGINSTLKVKKVDANWGLEEVNIPTKESLFNLTNGTTTPKNAHIEVKLDYTDINGSKFTFTADVSQNNNGIFKLPLLNHSVDRINVFSKDFAPRKLSLKADDLLTQPVKINLTHFRPGAPGGGEIPDVFIDMLKNTKECNRPYPNLNCSLMPAKNMSEFNPLSVIMGGGEISLRIRKASNNITVQYVNVDLLASGPPDADFATQPKNNIKESNFAQAWKFGSRGPEIYDYVIIGIPYTEASASQTGFNESAEIRLKIPYLYDDSWQVIWNQSAGDNITDILTNNTLKDFRDYINTSYEAYLNGTGVVCNESDKNLTGICYKDTANNMLWFKIPHFSGVGPVGEGEILKANGASCSAASQCTGGYCVHGYCRSSPTYCGDGYCDSGESCQSDCATGGTGGTSGGGGGGAYIPSTTSKAIHSWTKITPGKAEIMKITNREIGLKQIEIKVKNQANNVVITVTKLKGKPASVTKEISGKVYKYLEINAENLNETNLEEAKIQFEVNKTWITKNNLAKNRIYLYRFANNEWQKLKTRLINESSSYVNYEAETPGFSYYAVGGEEKVCDEGAKKCSNNELQQCINNAWVVQETCDYGCNFTTLQCNPKPTEEKICEEGAKRCLGNNLQECKNNTWTTIQTCNNGCNSTTLDCNPPKQVEKPKKQPINYWVIVGIVAVIIILAVGYYFGVYKKK